MSFLYSSLASQRQGRTPVRWRLWRGTSRRMKFGRPSGASRQKGAWTDVFTALFYQTCWGIIKGDVMAAFFCLGCSRSNNFNLLNQALITLFPKKLELQEPKDYRPISLLHSFAKLFSKVLSNIQEAEFSPHLATVVTPNQSVFIKLRSIHDNFNLIRLSARSLHQKRKQACYSVRHRVCF